MQAKRIVMNNDCPIDIGYGIAEPCAVDFFINNSGLKKALIVTDREVSGHYLSSFTDAFSKVGITVPHIIVDGSPSSKTIDMLPNIYERISDTDCDYVIALGGGGVIDIASFAAATFHKGVKSIRIPTTLLAMLESVTATHAMLHFQTQKDMIRVPAPLSYAVIDTAFLKTLPPRYLTNGIAQIIQYGLISAPSLLRSLSDSKPLNLLIEDALLAAQKIRSSNPELFAFGKDLADSIECHFRFLKYTPGEAMALSLLALCPSRAMRTLYERLGLVQTLTEVSKEVLIRRIENSIQKQGEHVELVRIGPEKRPVLERVPIKDALMFYDKILSEICH